MGVSVRGSARTLIVKNTHEEECEQDLPCAGILDSFDGIVEVLGQVDGSCVLVVCEHGGEASRGIGTDRGGVHGGRGVGQTRCLEKRKGSVVFVDFARGRQWGGERNEGYLLGEGKGREEGDARSGRRRMRKKVKWRLAGRRRRDTDTTAQSH